MTEDSIDGAVLAGDVDGAPMVDEDIDGVPIYYLSKWQEVLLLS
jgi:hypothetical protein